MRLVTVTFNYPTRLKRPDYLRLADVFESSVRHHMPECDVRVLRVDPPDHHGSHKIPFLSNCYKLIAWRDEVHRAVEDGQDLILADCDMVCVGDASKAFRVDNGDWDIAYTVRDDHTNIPLNGGVLYVRPTKASADFFDAWVETDQKMYHDWEGFHRIWRVKYAGMNQASFGYLLENPANDVRMIDLPTRVYNAVNTDWHRINQDTVFIHVKSNLRKMVLEGARPAGNLRPVMLLWYAEAERLEVTA